MKYIKKDITMEKDFSILPFISLSRENLELMNDLLDAEQIGNVMIALYEFIYNNKQPNLSKCEMSVYRQIMAVVERKSRGLFKQIEAGERGKDGGRPKKDKNKPIDESKEENSTEVPPRPKKPEIQPKNGQGMDLSPVIDIIKETSKSYSYEGWMIYSNSAYEKCLLMGYTPDEVETAYNIVFS